MYGNKSVINLDGANLLADKGTVIEAVEEDGIVKFKLENAKYPSEFSRTGSGYIF